MARVKIDMLGIFFFMVYEEMENGEEGKFPFWFGMGKADKRNSEDLPIAARREETAVLKAMILGTDWSVRTKTRDRIQGLLFSSGEIVFT